MLQCSSRWCLCTSHHASHHSPQSCPSPVSHTPVPSAPQVMTCMGSQVCTLAHSLEALGTTCSTQHTRRPASQMVRGGARQRNCVTSWQPHAPGTALAHNTGMPAGSAVQVPQVSTTGRQQLCAGLGTHAVVVGDGVALAGRHAGQVEAVDRAALLVPAADGVFHQVVEDVNVVLEPATARQQGTCLKYNQQGRLEANR